MNINLIYGTETGYTQIIGANIQERWTQAWPDDGFHMVRIDETLPCDWENADLYILGAPTWCEPRLEVLGEMSEDWNDEFDYFSTLDFKDKKVAIYGLGDQVGYGDNFVDAIGMLAKVVEKNGGLIIGNTLSYDYNFTKSEGLKDDETFYGLAIDEDNEPNKTNVRIVNWLEKIERELGDRT